jgi:DNA-binding MarR family transcriptional regulator
MKAEKDAKNQRELATAWTLWASALPAESVEVRALRATAELKSGSIKDLALALAMSHSGTVRLVDRLVGQRWLVRDEGTDARSVRLKLTQRGSKHLAECDATLALALQNSAAQLPIQARVRLVEVLSKPST